MKKNLMQLLFAATVMFAVSCAPATAPEESEFRTAQEINEALGRGVNMGNTFEAPDEHAWFNPWDPEYFEIMAEIGFSHVRIPIRWTTPERSMAEPPYTIFPEFMNRIQKVVDTAIKNGLHAVINLHHHQELFENPLENRDRFLAQWVQIASFFKDYPDSLVFEILNEPHNNLTPELWNEFLRDALEIIRKENPDRTVMIGTANWGGLGGLPELSLPDDPKLILTIHYYNPFRFTHQGASWVADHPVMDWVGTTWDNTKEERQAVKDDFQIAIDFAGKHNVPVHIGEFGAIQFADMDSRARWTNFLTRWFEEQGFSWAYWEFSADMYGFYNPQTREFATPLKNALLHNPMPEPSDM